MKTVTVNVQIQMDINDSENNEKTLEQVVSVIEAVNAIVSISEIESQPQIFTSDISTSDIVLNEKDENDLIF